MLLGHYGRVGDVGWGVLLCNFGREVVGPNKNEYWGVGRGTVGLIGGVGGDGGRGVWMETLDGG